MALSALSILLLLIPAYLLYTKRQRKGYLLPPGPKGWPVLGNALDIPLESMAPVYRSWAKKFGSDVVSASALGTTLVILDSYDAAIELLERRAANYSSRPVSVMACELMGWDFVFALSPYSEAWKQRRRLFVRYFRQSTDGAAVHTPQITEFVQRLLLDLNETPHEFYGLVRSMVGGLAISLAYGLPIQRRRDPIVEFVDKVARMLTQQVTPGKAIVDVIPSLKYLPSWFPGAGFKRFAKSVRWMAVKFKMEPYEKAVQSFGTSDVRPSFLSSALASLEADGAKDILIGSAEGNEATKCQEERLDAIQDVAATIFGTAADTTTSSILTFIFALATHPDIRKRVQAELDALLIEDLDCIDIAPTNTSGKRMQTLRLPTFEDQEKLPYLMATVMETLRWVPVAPIGVPHRTTEDDFYNGYFIPKDSVVIANQWSMLNDEKEYGPDTHSFNPGRFIRERQNDSISSIELDPSIRHPSSIAFGFGRRVCPGSHVAQSTLWYTAACLLTLFDFESSDGKANYVDPNDELKVDGRLDPGFLCHPRPYNCKFKVRSPEAAALLTELGMSV